VKAALFLCAGMLLHRLHSVDELQLHGRGRNLRALGILMASAGLLLAGAPLSGLFVGESTIHHALHAHPLAKAAMTISAIVTAAAVLRACGRIFLGWGPREQDAPGGGEPDEEPETRPGRIHWTMGFPAVLLALAAIASAAIPREAAGRTAARMLDNHAWAVRVLDGHTSPSPEAPQEDPLSYSHGALTAAAALALAGLTLARRRLPAALRTAVRASWHPLARGLRALHTGEVGDQVAWLTLGAALLGCAMLFLQ
jgi:multicomponent Na+:H+ antiporter subunit D